MTIGEILGLWPLALVILLAVVFIRAGRRRPPHAIRGNGDYAQDRHNSRTDHGSGGGGGGEG